jgi:serine/threonine protein kinase
VVAVGQRRVAVNDSVSTPPDDSALGPGDRLGPYVIVRRLNAGGMSTVYLAEHPVLGRQAALKVLRPQGQSLERLRRHWLDESRILARIQHPRVVAIYDADIDPKRGIFWLAEQYVGDVVLRNLLHDCQPLEIGLALSILQDITEGVRAGHLADAVHRDLKPDNIAITEGGACVFDFGIAKALNALTSHDAKHIVGTAAYMAKEQFERGAVGPATDIFALGLMTAEMVLGTHPLSRTWGKLDLPRPTEIYALYQQGLSTHLASTLAEHEVPDDLTHFILGAAAAEPSARYQDTFELLCALEPLCARYHPMEVPQVSGRSRSSQPNLLPSHYSPVPPAPPVDADIAQVVLPTMALPLVTRKDDGELDGELAGELDGDVKVLAYSPWPSRVKMGLLGLVVVGVAMGITTWFLGDLAARSRRDSSATPTAVGEGLLPSQHPSLEPSASPGHPPAPELGGEEPSLTAKNPHSVVAPLATTTSPTHRVPSTSVASSGWMGTRYLIRAQSR